MNGHLTWYVRINGMIVGWVVGACEGEALEQG